MIGVSEARPRCLDSRASSGEAGAVQHVRFRSWPPSLQAMPRPFPLQTEDRFGSLPRVAVHLAEISDTDPR